MVERGRNGPGAGDFCMMPVEGVLVEGEGAWEGVEGGIGGGMSRRRGGCLLGRKRGQGEQRSGGEQNFARCWFNGNLEA